MTTATHVRDTAAPASYRFGTGAPAGIWLGLGLSQVVILAAALICTVVLLALRAGLVAGLCPLLLAAALTLVPVGGRPLSGWLTPAVGHLPAVATGAARWRAALPQASTTSAGGWSQDRRLRLPPECGQVRLRQLLDPATGLPLAVLTDRRPLAATVLFSVAGPDRFGLLDPDGQDRHLTGWGRALTALAQRDRDTGRVQLLERVTVTEPDTDAATEWTAHRGADAELSSLAQAVGQATVRRDSVLAVHLGSLRDPSAAIGRARDVAAQLLAAELVARPLTEAEIAGLFGRLLRPGEPTTIGDVGPVSRRAAWDHVRTDDTWHRSYAVTTWPGSPVPASWLSSLLLASPRTGAWSISVHLAAVPPELAARIARAARAKAELDRADRARLGLTASAAADKAVIESADMDAELVAGHATHRLGCVLTCTAGSPEELEDCARGLRDAVGSAGLTVRPLHGQHHLALAASLPLCRLRLGGVA